MIIKDGSRNNTKGDKQVAKDLAVINQEIVKKETGYGVQISAEDFEAGQKKILESVCKIADKNKCLDWKRFENDHNNDFCLIGGKIEPVKNFALKCAFFAGLDIVTEGITENGEGVNLRIVARVKVIEPRTGRSVSHSGASTAIECGAKWSKPNKRYYHDMVARAETRALKKGVENIMGFPFINQIMQEIFGGFEITEEEMGQSKEAKKITSNIMKTLNKSVAAGTHSKEEMDDYRKRGRAANGDIDLLLRIQNEIIQEIRARN
jgi:hypothetical protein